MYRTKVSNDYSAALRQAFLESIDVLGKRTCRALIEDLQRYRVFLYDQNLSIENLARGLRELVGEKSAQLLLERVYIKLDEMHSQPPFNGSNDKHRTKLK